MADMNQLINDWKLILKNDRRLWAAGGLIGFIILFLMFTHQPERPLPPVSGGQNTGGVLPDGDNSAAKDLMTAFTTEMNSIKNQAREKEEEIAKLNRDLKSTSEETGGILSRIVEEIESIKDTQNKIQERIEQKPEPSVSSTSTEQGLEGEGGIVPFGFNPEATVEEPKPISQEITRMTAIMPGDAVQATLLTGVNAPTDGTPYPSVFRLDGPIRGPDGSALDLGSARVIAAAQGSEVDGRALFRITSLAFRYPDGRRAVLKVDGWVVGEDGIRGMSGRVIDKLGQLIATIAGTSFAAALGGRLDDKSDVVVLGRPLSVSNDDLGVASTSALTNASAAISRVLIDRYSKMIPVVEVLSGRKASVIFAAPVEVAECGEECNAWDTQTAALD